MLRDIEASEYGDGAAWTCTKIHIDLHNRAPQNVHQRKKEVKKLRTRKKRKKERREERKKERKEKKGGKD